jgi:phage baseplate assembly protein gpV
MSLPISFVAGDNASDVGRLQFVIRAALSGLRTAMPVRVEAVTNDGGLSPIGTVDVQPLVSSVDGDEGTWEMPLISNVPYMRIQGGTNGIIIDPVVGDIGIATTCDRDISTVKNTSDISAPGSVRKHDMSDIVYLMTIIGAEPTQYVQFNTEGITINSPNAITINAPEINSNGTWNHTGTITASGDVEGSGTSLHTHIHGGVQTGGGQTGTPI